MKLPVSSSLHSSYDEPYWHWWPSNDGQKKSLIQNVCALTHLRLFGYFMVILKIQLSTILKKVKVAIVPDQIKVLKIWAVSRESFRSSVHRAPRCWVFPISHPQPNQNGKGFAHRQWPQDSFLFRMPGVICPIREYEEAHDNPQQWKSTQMCQMQ